MNAITQNETSRLAAPEVTFQLNGTEITARSDETLIQIAQREGVAIPHLCYKEGSGAGWQLPFLRRRDQG